MPGSTVTDIEPRREEDELWRGLRAHFPPDIASHSTRRSARVVTASLLRVLESGEPEYSGALPSLNHCDFTNSHWRSRCPSSSRTPAGRGGP